MWRRAGRVASGQRCRTHDLRRRAGGAGAVRDPASASRAPAGRRRGGIEETPKPFDAAFARASAHVVGEQPRRAGGRRARGGAAGLPRAHRGGRRGGRGEQRGRAGRPAGCATRWRSGRPGPWRCCWAARTTVTVHGRDEAAPTRSCARAGDGDRGRGGRARRVARHGRHDGPTDAAGAFADGGTVARGEAAGLDARAGPAPQRRYRSSAPPTNLIARGPRGRT